jgi:hypothetical protein
MEPEVAVVAIGVAGPGLKPEVLAGVDRGLKPPSPSVTEV